MKKISIIFCFIIFLVNCNIKSSAQALASNFISGSANSSQKTIVSSPKELAAIVIQSAENKFSIGLHVESYVEGTISIKLRSSNSVLHKEVVESNTYARKYDMYNLPVGDYQIEVENKNEVYVKKITIRNKNGVRVLSII